MAKHFELIPSKTYATRENAIKAVEKKGFADYIGDRQLRYFIMQHTDGRFFPVFVAEAAIQAGAHFHFNVIS